MTTCIKKQWHTISFLLFFFAFLGFVPMSLADESSIPVAQTQEYTFGVFPFLTPTTLEGIFSPIAAEVSTAPNRPIRFQSAGTFGKFMDNLEQQHYDIAHIQPFDYVRIAVKSGYLPLATRLDGVDPKFRKLFMPSAEIQGAYFRSVTDQEYDSVRHYLEIIGDK